MVHDHVPANHAPKSIVDYWDEGEGGRQCVDVGGCLMCEGCVLDVCVWCGRVVCLMLEGLCLMLEGYMLDVGGFVLDVGGLCT